MVRVASLMFGCVSFVHLNKLVVVNSIKLKTLVKLVFGIYESIQVPAVNNTKCSIYLGTI